MTQQRKAPQMSLPHHATKPSFALACASGLAVLSACTSPDPAATPVPTLDPPPARSTERPDPRQDAEHAYTRFWDVSWSSDHVPAEQLRSVLDKVAADPLLGQLVDRTQQQHQQGIVLYGRVQSHVTEIHVDGDHATVADCQDASRAGQADAATGQPRTAGVDRSPISGSLTRIPDGGWRVTRIDYIGGAC